MDASNWPGCTDCNRYIGGFSMGVRSVDPDITLQVAYLTDNFYDAVIAVDLSSGYRQVVAR